MRLQTNVFSSECCENPNLYVRTTGNVLLNADSAVLPPGSSLSTDTYMNVFDTSFWRKHTVLNSFDLCFQASGRATVELICRHDGAEDICDSVTVESNSLNEYLLRQPDEANGLIFFRVTAHTETRLQSAAYVTRDTPCRTIKLGAALCTYHRLPQIIHNLEILKASRFFDPNDPLYGSLLIHVTDNGDELPPQQGEYIRVFRNENSGGSGGFSRSLQEFRARQNELQLSHVFFMDDDVEFMTESLYRLYAFLSYARDGDTVVAGRMFRQDATQIQYTAAEIWNGGDLRHIGFNADMTDSGRLETVNRSDGADYGGWWFCCYPAAYALTEEPMPFFLHCDDVEYGLRYGKQPLILNGIQVWHETYEHRPNPLISCYYDYRNPLFVNERYAPELMDPKELYRNWLSRISKYHREEDWRGEYLMIAAMSDYLRGEDFLRKHGTKRHRQLRQKQHFTRWENMIFWRLTTLSFRLHSWRSGNRLRRG